MEESTKGKRNLAEPLDFFPAKFLNSGWVGVGRVIKTGTEWIARKTGGLAGAVTLDYALRNILVCLVVIIGLVFVKYAVITTLIMVYGVA